MRQFSQPASQLEARSDTTPLADKMNSDLLRTGRLARKRKTKHKPKDPEYEQAEAFKFGLILAADDLGQTKGAVGRDNKAVLPRSCKTK